MTDLIRIPETGQPRPKLRPIHINQLVDRLDGLPTAGEWTAADAAIDANTAAIARVDPGTTQVNVASYADIQAAYDDLPSGGGIVYIPAGRHDVGSGVALNRTKPATFRGTGRWARGNALIGDTQGPYPGNDPVIYSSTNAAYLFDASLPDSYTNGYGFSWEGLVLEGRGDNFDAAIHAPCLSSATVTDCRLWVTDDAPLTAAKMIHAYVDTDLGDDASWWRVYNNTISRGALGVFGAPAGGNNNQNMIWANFGFGKYGIDPTSLPFVSFYHANRCMTLGNNIEHYQVGIYAESAWNCTFEGDGGEGTEVFVDLNGTSSSIIAPQGVSAPSTQTLIRMDVDCEGNVFIIPTRMNYGATTFDDPSGALDRNTVLGGRTPRFGGNTRAQGDASASPVLAVQNNGGGAMLDPIASLDVLATNWTDTGPALRVRHFGEHPIGIRVEHGGIEFGRGAAPAAPDWPNGHMFVRDNGSGKSQLCILFSSGAVQVIATEP